MQMHTTATRQFMSGLPVVRLTQWRLHPAPGVQVFVPCASGSILTPGLLVWLALEAALLRASGCRVGWRPSLPVDSGMPMKETWLGPCCRLPLANRVAAAATPYSFHRLCVRCRPVLPEQGRLSVSRAAWVVWKGPLCLSNMACP